MLILEKLQKGGTRVLLGEEGPHGGRAWFAGRAATAGGLRSGRLNEIIITYLGNLSMSNYKWFGYCGIAAGKVETRNVKVETGRAERVKPRTLCKTKPQRVRHPGASQRVKGAPPAAGRLRDCTRPSSARPVST